MGDETMTPTPAPTPQSSRVKIFVILIVAIVCLIVGAFVYRSYRAPIAAVPAVLKPVFANTDSDLDGLSDAEEAQLGTDPQKADTDGDGLPDGYEVRISNTDPKNAHSKDPNLTDSAWLQKSAPRR